jgi:hypothetical protein
MADASALFSGSFVFAAASSLHCAGMCGPLALLFGGDRRAATGYHAARIVSYCVAGALAGSLGAAVGVRDLAAHGAWFAFVLAAMLCAIAFGGERRLGAIPGVGRIVAAVVRRVRDLPVLGRGLVLGAVTPLLPCGLLYAALSAALLAGSLPAGTVSMLGFALGSLPVLLLGQLQVGWLRSRLGAGGLRRVTTVAMLAAAAALAWRGVAELRGGCCDA